MLVGDEQGVAEAATELGTRHVYGVAVSERGTPRIDDAFARVDEVAAHPLRCFVNADVLLLDDLLPAVDSVRARFDRFLIVGETRDLDVRDAISPGRRRAAPSSGAVRSRRDARAARPPSTTSSSPPASSTRCLRSSSAARASTTGSSGARASAARSSTPPAPSCGVHQRHDYAHVPGGFEEAHFGGEARRNEELAGGGGQIYTIFDASHRLQPGGVVRRHAGSTLRIRERARKAAWKLAQLGR